MCIQFGIRNGQCTVILSRGKMGKSRKYTTYSPSSVARMKGAITVTEEEIGHGLRSSWTGPTSAEVSSGVVCNGTTSFGQLKCPSSGAPAGLFFFLRDKENLLLPLSLPMLESKFYCDLNS